MLLLARIGPLLGALAFLSCDTPCTLDPCGPEPIAFTVTLVSSAGGPVPDARLDAPDNSLHVSLCGSPRPLISKCSIPGPAGTYTFLVSAPGFVTTTGTVVVKEGPRVPTDRCYDCPTTIPQDITIVMTPSLP